MARAFVRGSSQYVEASTAVLTAVPVTMACWFNSSDTTHEQVLMALGSSSTQNVLYLAADGNVGGDPIAAWTFTAAGVKASTTTGYSANTWHHACAIWAADDDRRAFIDGGSKGTDANNRAVANLDRTAISSYVWNGGHGSYVDGMVAEPCIWNDALTDEEVWQLYVGVPPWRIRPGNLVMHLPFRYNRTWDRDVRRGLLFAPVNSPSWAADPQKPIMYWRNWELPLWRKLGLAPTAGRIPRHPAAYFDGPTIF